MKKYLPGIAAVLLAISFSAFTTTNLKVDSRAGEKWFKFNGVDPADVNNPNKYSLDGSGASPTVCTNTTLSYRCEIHAVPQSGNPSLPNLSTINGQTKRSTP